MKLAHYSSCFFDFDPKYKYLQNAEPHFKPAGFWLSVEGEYGWPEWCKEEEFLLDGLNHKTEFELTESGNVLHIKSKEELDDLDRFLPKHNTNRYFVNWTPIIEDYDGIIISPYRWESRFTVSWYYGWDCASGCIWNLGSIRTKRYTEAGI